MVKEAINPFFQTFLLIFSIMGNCQSKKRQKSTEQTSPKMPPQEPSARSTVKIQLRRKTGLFGSKQCPIDNQNIENVQKQLGNYNIEIVGLEGEYLDEWKPVKFRRPAAVNEWWYHGEWKGKKMHGRGSLYNTVHEYLISGSFNHDCLFKERCRKIFKNGSYYIGQVNDKLDPQGQGELITSPIEKYVGQFVNGVPNGHGKLIKKQYEFIGKFQNGLKLKGIMRNDRGSYDGQFSNDMRNGHGVQQYSTGQKFVGEFVRNKRTEGVLYDKDGNILMEGKMPAISKCITYDDL